ncbi:MAG: DNA repair protein RecN [Chloroflexi bacterium]|nr:DNA repair protein RecN [Chloroflexota bacterium]
MLAELRICDLAIIDELQLSFGPGFSVLTGETGAGKSIIIDAVELVLGGRADATVVRAGSDRALVEAVFHLEADQRQRLDPVLVQEGLESDDPTVLLLAREVRVEGRNVCRVNGRSVTLGILKDVAAGLVDIHGQSEHLSLLHTRNQLDLLDRYAGLLPLREELAGVVKRVQDVRAELDSLIKSEQELAHRADLLRFQIDEIRAASLREGEEEELDAERVRLSNAEQLAQLAAQVLTVLEEAGEEAPAALDLLGTAVRALESLARIDTTLLPQAQLVESVTYQVEELARTVRDYRDSIEFSPRRLQNVEDRLALIHNLERKYGATISSVLTYADEAEHELNRITHSEERITELQAGERSLLDALARLALDLSHRRREAAQELAVGIERELNDLQMEGARFGVAFRWREAERGVLLPDDVCCSQWDVLSSGAERSDSQEDATLRRQSIAFDSTGIDRIEFMISPNPGEPLKSMARIASGGETARLMLALKAVLSHADETPTLVFDEIDQGIGGRVAVTVGRKLWGLTARPHGERGGHQVLCVTHLPQLAGFGDAHLQVEKAVVGERTVTRVRLLNEVNRVQELALMLGASGEAAYRSAEEILDHVGQLKHQET